MSTKTRIVEVVNVPALVRLFTSKEGRDLLVNKIIPYEKKLTFLFEEYNINPERSGFLRAMIPELYVVDPSIVNEVFDNIDFLLELNVAKHGISNELIGGFRVPKTSSSRLLREVRTGLGNTEHIPVKFLQRMNEISTTKHIYQNLDFYLDDFLELSRRNDLAEDLSSADLVLEHRGLDDSIEFKDILSEVLAEDDSFKRDDGTIPDAVLYLTKTPILLKNGATYTPIYKFEITFDSKFYSYPNGLYSAKSQMMKQLFGGKRFDILLDMSNKLRTQHDFTSEEIAEELARVIPHLFKHYITVPKNYSPSSTIGANYAVEIKRTAEYMLEPLTLDMGTNERNILQTAFNNFADSFYGGNHFIKNMDLSHPNLPLITP